MKFEDISNQTLLEAMLAIMTPEEIFWELPEEAQDDIRWEIEDRLNITLEEG